MRFAIIENGRVANIAIADGPIAPNWIASDDAGIGWDCIDGVLSAPVLPEPEPTAPVVPSKITMRQARLVLFAAGKLTAVTTAINALPSPEKEKAQIEWEYSNEVQRHNGFVAQLGPALGLSDEQIDALFITGATL